MCHSNSCSQYSLYNTSKSSSVCKSEIHAVMIADIRNVRKHTHYYVLTYVVLKEGYIMGCNLLNAANTGMAMSVRDLRYGAFLLIMYHCTNVARYV